jgi:LysM repeat protein
LFAAVALAAYLVQPGDTLSGIAASHGTSLAAVEAANPSFTNPNLIFAGQTVDLPEGSSAAQGSTTAPSAAPTYSGSQSTATQSASSYAAPSSTTASASAHTSYTGSSAPSAGTSSSSLSDIPGVPSSFAACVAYRESTNDTNPAANGDAYGIIPASGYNVEGTSLANQKQVFEKLYQQYGTSPWASDGCA